MNLYKNKEDQKLTLKIKHTCDNEFYLLFTSDCGKFGTDEILDSYKLSAERLLEILQDREDYTDKEL